MMTRDDICAYAKQHRLAVLASTAADGSPQAAIVGVAVTGDLELIFDTLNTSRKYANLKADPRAAFVIGKAAQTLQYQGIAEELSGEALASRSGPMGLHARVCQASLIFGCVRPGCATAISARSRQGSRR